MDTRAEHAWTQAGTRASAPTGRTKLFVFETLALASPAHPPPLRPAVLRPPNPFPLFRSRSRPACPLFSLSHRTCARTHAQPMLANTCLLADRDFRAKVTTPQSQIAISARRSRPSNRKSRFPRGNA
eukprot:6195100-Pleurochrysis_carterae.AAC.1